MNDRIKMVKDGNSVYRSIPITEAEIEALRMMQNHPAWAIYKNLMQAQRDNVLFGLMSSENNESKYSKRIGVAEGLHLASITLDQLIRDFDQKAKRVAEESTNQPPR